jgi:16S rRNA (cytosine967-C5)-methyltransferase
MIAPARSAAYQALRAVAEGRADLPTALARSRQHLRDERDRALAVEIVTGTTRWQRTLDHLIEHFAKRSAARVDPEILVILRLSLYQVLHLSRVPASAVVDDAVDLARAARKPSAAGFVNAVLRNTLRQRHRLPLPARPDDAQDRARALAYLGLTHSHPEWLIARWLHRYGFDATERWVQFNNQTPSLTVRANTLRVLREEVARVLADDDIETEPTAHAPHGLTVVAGNPLRRPPEGLFFVQDEASQLVPLAVDAKGGDRVLDLCASPGGKTTAMAGDMGDSGIIIASDVRNRRLALLTETIHASGATCVRIVRVGGEGALPFAPVFDRVLVDAPCSGLGTIRRDPDIRWRRSEADLASMARDQVALLSRAADVVAPGGRLVYATCSSEPEENEGVVDAFLQKHANFTLVDLRDGGPEVMTPFVDTRGMMRTLPFEHGLEAFFAAALVKNA